MTGKDAKRQIAEARAFFKSATDLLNTQRMDLVRKVNEIRDACPHESVSIDVGQYVHDSYCADCGALVRRGGDF
jgi:hypothetical protein